MSHLDRHTPEFLKTPWCQERKKTEFVMRMRNAAIQTDMQRDMRDDDPMPFGMDGADIWDTTKFQFQEGVKAISQLPEEDKAVAQAIVSEFRNHFSDFMKWME